MSKQFLTALAKALTAFTLSFIVYTSSAYAQSEADFDSSIDAARASMMRDPSAALEAAQDAAAAARGLPQAEAQRFLAQAEWLQAEAMTRLGRPAQAAEIAERAIERLGAEPEPTKLYADLRVAQGRIAMAMGRFDTAFISFTTAYEVFQTLGDARSQAIVLQSIGSIYTAAKQYERALSYFTDARERHSDPALDLAAHNNTANAHRAMGAYGAALDEYQAALGVAEAMDSAVLQARILNNVGALHVQFEAYDAAEAAIQDAYARLDGVGSGEWLRFLRGVEAQIAAGRGDYPRARDHLEATFDGLSLAETPQNFSEFHEAGVELYSALGDWALALEHLTAFKRLEDEARDIAASANSALLGAQFEFAEQELQIEQLRSERLAQDLALAGERARNTILSFAVAAALLICLLIFGAQRYRSERARKTALAEALYMDAETRLPSRSALEKTLARKAEAGFEFQVFALELDRHEHLRAALGFAAFAELTNAIAARLKEGRDPDEVGIIAPGVLGVLIDMDTMDIASTENEVEKAAAGLLAVFDKPIVLDEATIDLSAVAGAALHSFGDLESDLTIKRAVIAVRQARAARKTFAEYDASLFGDPARNLALMSRMSSAMEAGHMALHYQPKLDLRSGAFASAEALIRWTDPDRGYVAPDAFIPLAEDTGRILELTLWTLEKAVIDQFAFAKAGFEMKLAVNISGALLTDPGFASRAAQIAGQSRHGLIFEITETAIMADVEKALKTLHLWSRAGVQLSIDDYGTGQSSLAYLKRIPANELKLDRAFIAEVTQSQRDRLLVKATVDLAHNLGLALTAEGVEDEETLAALKLMGVDTAQGFGICKPCGVMDLIGRLQRDELSRGSIGSANGRQTG